MIDDHVNGRTYDLDVFEPVWEAAEELGVFLLVHQFNNTVVGLRTQEYFLLNSIGNLVDRTITFASFIYGGVLDRHPGLTICLCHGGGYVPYALDRLDKGWDVWPDMRGKIAGPPSSYIRRFYFDTVVYTPREPPVPDRRRRRRPRRVRNGLAGADDVRRSRRAARDDDGAVTGSRSDAMLRGTAASLFDR